MPTTIRAHFRHRRDLCKVAGDEPRRPPGPEADLDDFTMLADPVFVSVRRRLLNCRDRESCDTAMVYSSAGTVFP